MRLLGAHGRRAAVARHAVRRRRHPARPAHPPGALGDLELADDPAAVRRRRAGRRLRHRHRDVRVGRARAGVACSVPRRMAPSRSPPTAPTTCRERSPIARASTRSACTSAGSGESERELEMAGFDAFYERLRTRPRTADHLPALDRRLPRRVGAAARATARTSSRSTSPAASRAPARPPARRTRCWPSAASASASR